MDLYDTRKDILPHLLKVNPKANQWGDLHHYTTINNSSLEITLYNVEPKHTIEVKQIVEDSVEEMYHMQGGNMSEIGIELKEHQWKIIKNIFFSTALELNQSMEVGQGNW